MGLACSHTQCTCPMLTTRCIPPKLCSLLPYPGNLARSCMCVVEGGRAGGHQHQPLAWQQLQQHCSIKVMQRSAVQRPSQQPAAPHAPPHALVHRHHFRHLLAVLIDAHAPVRVCSSHARQQQLRVSGAPFGLARRAACGPALVHLWQGRGRARGESCRVASGPLCAGGLLQHSAA